MCGTWFVSQFLSIAGSFGALLVGWLVVLARAVSRKTPIYFIKISVFQMKRQSWTRKQYFSLGALLNKEQ